MYSKRSKLCLGWASLALFVAAPLVLGQSPPLDFVWAKRAGGANNDFSDGVAVDASGNVYVTGSYQSSPIYFDSLSLTNAGSGTYDIFLTKYDPSGNALWARRAGGTRLDYSYGIATDATGNVYVTGSFSSAVAAFGNVNLTNANAGSGDIFVAKYSSAGNVLWARRAGGADYEDGDGIAVDASGNVYVTGGYSSATITFGSITLTNYLPGTEDLFVAKYDSSGNVLWAKRAGGDDFDSGLGIAVDAGGSVYVTGYYYSTNMAFNGVALPNFSAGYDDIFVAKYDTAGGFLWARHAGGGGYDRGVAIAVDATSNVYVTGSFESTNATFGTAAFASASPGLDDGFLMKYDSSGNFKWAKQLGGDGAEQGAEVAVDTAGNVYLTGHFSSSSLTMGNITLTNSNPGADDVFVIEFDPAGNCLWAKSAGGDGFDGGYGLALDAAGDAFVTGSFYSALPVFGGMFLTDYNLGTSDVFLAKLAPPPPQLTVSPASRDFGTVAVGGNAQASFVISNLGAGTITNGAISINGGPFTVLSATSFSLPASGSTNVQVRFSPAAAGSFSSFVVVTSANGGASTNPVTGVGAQSPAAGFTANPPNGPMPLAVSFTDNSTGTISNRSWDFGDGTITNTAATALEHTYSAAGSYTVSLTVSGPLGTSTLTRTNVITVVNPPHLSVNPASLAFGQVVLGHSGSQSFAVANTGGGTLTGTVSAASPFAIQGAGPFPLTAGQTGLVTVSFSPTNATTFNSLVVFTSTGGDSSNPVSGSGLTPGQLAVSPSSLDFGYVAVGGSGQASFHVSNLGGAALSGSAALLSPAAAGFGFASSTAFTVPGGTSTDVVVRFTPPSAGGFSNGVVFVSGEAGSSTNLLSGAGALAPTAAFSGGPTVGLAPLSVTFTDSSTGTITNRFWDFGDGSTLNSQFPTVAHTFSSAATNTVVLTVSGPVGSDALSRPGYVVVTNPPPPHLSISPPSLAFGSVQINDSATRTFQVVNTGGQALTGAVTTTDPFAISDGSPFSIQPGQTGFVTVAFSPVDPGALTNLVVWTSNGGNSTNSLTGYTPKPGELWVTPFSLDFGAVPPGGQAQASFRVHNLGEVTLTNAGITVDPGPFTILGPTNFTLAGGALTNVLVRFAPTNNGSFSNHVLFDGGAAGRSFAVVSGRGGEFRITSMAVSNANVLLRFNSEAGKVYRVECADTLQGSAWRTAADFVLATTNQTRATHVAGADRSARFYRIRLLNPAELVPAAGFSASQTVGQFPFTVIFVDNSYGWVTNRFWDFGDGTTLNTSAATAAHTYTSPATNTVTLVVSGPVGTSTSTRGAYITAVDPARITSVSLAGTNVLVRFTTAAGWFYRLEYSSSLTPADWRPTSDFLAGSGDIVQAIHAGGAAQGARFYRVKLLSNSEVVPAADFSASRTSGALPFTVTFTDNSAGLITNRFWDFGDGFTAHTTAASIIHTYATAGTSTVTMTVTGPLGTDTLSRTSYIVAFRAVPISSIRLSGTTVFLTFSTTAGIYYRLEYTTSLSGTGWTTALDNIPGTGGAVTVTDQAVAGQSRYYRVRQLP